MRSTVRHRRGTRVLYAGLVLFVTLTAFTARAVWLAWHDRSGQARADAIFDLVEERTPLRPTDTPGATAWLQLELDRYGRQISAPDRAARFRAFATGGNSVPDDLTNVVAAMRQGLAESSASEPISVTKPAAAQAGSLREEAVLTARGHSLVLTRRRDSGTADVAGDPFVRTTASALAHAAENVAASLRTQPLPATPDDRMPHPVRLYAVCDDGTLVSAPWASEGAANADARELTLLSGRPQLPSFAPQEFFFRFPPHADAHAAWYSGFYLDLGGRGLVSTVMMPVEAQGRRGVVALDLAFDIDWSAFAQSVDRPVAGAAVGGLGAGSASWSSFDAKLANDAPESLRAAVGALARGDQAAIDLVTPVRQGVAEGVGAVVAFRVADATWLLMLFPLAPPAFPVVPLVLMVGLLALLLSGFEVNRRRAEAERLNAERAFTEKQNLLDTMQVPLVVVDPNTDVIVSSNRSAEAIGLRTGSRFADFVSTDSRARAHYEKMQVATPEPRRAYGVPVRVPTELNDSVARHAVVRSVAVTAPIAALNADERHRLGIVFLLEQDADLPILSEDIAWAAHREERQRLAGLLSHGVDTLARVLEHHLKQTQDTSEARAFGVWLSEYLERRLTVTGWLLDHWDFEVPEPAEVVIDASQARATVERLCEVFELARRDRDLRARLHWSNGVLSGSGGQSLKPGVLGVHIDWPSAVVISCPVRGGFGVFIGELLTNAIRHGSPGSVPTLDVAFDRVRRDVQFRLTNPADTGVGVPDGDPYGGLEMVRVMARLFGWTLTLARHPDSFVASWSAPASDRGSSGQAD
ncbi:MAG TPA: ATP-binding protein [Vicinamibacterales bacterium]|nr:ATP-binding protein [Vicinamibacterales bacterium]